MRKRPLASSGLSARRVSATPHLAVAPFPFWTVAPAASGPTADHALQTHGSPDEAASVAAAGGWRAREFHMAVLAWPLRDVVEGEEVRRCGRQQTLAGDRAE